MLAPHTCSSCANEWAERMQLVHEQMMEHKLWEWCAASTSYHCRLPVPAKQSSVQPPFISFAVACGIPPSQSLIMNLQSEPNDTHALAFWAAELEISSSDEISATHTCQVQDLEMESSSKPSTWGPIPDQWHQECQLSMQSSVG